MRRKNHNSGYISYRYISLQWDPFMIAVYRMNNLYYFFFLLFFASHSSLYPWPLVDEQKENFESQVTEFQ